MSRIILILSGLGLITMFQNCQKTVDFSSNQSAMKASGELTEVVLDDNVSDDVDIPSNDNPDDVAENPPDLPEEPKHPNEPKHPKDPPCESNPPVRVAREAGAGEFVCILDGPGKTVKLGLAADGALQGQNKVPQVVCMSEAACLDIISKKFTVKGPEARGYCKENGNPHVVHLSDAEIAAK